MSLHSEVIRIEIQESSSATQESSSATQESSSATQESSSATGESSSATQESSSAKEHEAQMEAHLVVGIHESPRAKRIRWAKTLSVIFLILLFFFALIAMLVLALKGTFHHQ